MAGLLDFFTNKENPEPLLLLMGLAGAAGSRNSGEAVRNGLTGLLQGIVAIDNKKDEDAKYLAAQSRQSRQDELEARVKEAQIQHYLYQQKNGADPYWTTLDTPQGLVKFNARTGEALPIDINGQPIIKSSSDVGLQGALSGAKKNAETANTMFEQEGADGSKQRYMGSQFPNYQPPQQQPFNTPANNNFGNIMRMDGKGFESYPTPEAGMDALSRQIGLYSSKHGIHDLNSFTSRYAPKGHGNNNPEAYAKFLSQQTGIPLDAKNVDFSNPDINAAMTKAIPIMEQGWRSNPQAALKEVSGGNAFSAPVVQAAKDAVQNGVMTQKQATQMAQSVARGIQKDVADPFRSPTKAELLAQETAVKADQAKNEAQIKLDYVAPTEKAKILAENQANAQVGLPKAQAEAQSILETINELRNHPGLDKGIGASSMFFNRVPGTDAYDFANLHENARGKVFMQAYESLKGAGAITEQEGKAATNAISAMGDLKQSKESYLNELSKLERIVNNSLARKQNAAGSNPQTAPASNVDDLVGKYLR